jgi:hypothetical protein
VAELGPCEAFYASPAQHPWLLWSCALLAGIPFAVRDLAPSLRRYGFALVVLSLLDAWLTAHHVYGIGTLPPSLSSAVQLGFVLAGDFRFLLLVTAARPDGSLAPGARSIGVAAALTVVVPLFAQAAVALLPEPWSPPRALFLVYELAFVAWTLALMRLFPNLAPDSWVRSVARFVIVYYSLWAAADAVLIATGSDLGFGIRVVPNVLYYGGLIAAIGLLAPRRRV